MTKLKKTQIVTVVTIVKVVTVVTVVTKKIPSLNLYLQFFSYFFWSSKIVTKLENSNCDKTLKLKLLQNSENTNCDKTQKLKL